MIELLPAWLLKRIGNFFYSPIFPEDEAKTALASAIQTYMVSLAVLLVLALPASLVFFSQRVVMATLLVVVGLSAWGVWQGVRGGYVHQAAVLALVIFWLVTTGMVGISNGMLSLNWAFYIPGTVAAALFYGIPGALGYALAAVFAGLIFVALDAANVSLPLFFDFNPISSWLLLVYNLLMTLLPLIIHLQRQNHTIRVAQMELVERRRYQAEAARLNTELEQRVRERTAELEATNQEIEAYTSSISHDLRAPIRSIVGFTQIVLSAHGELLPGEARRDLEKVSQSGFHLSRMVDGLLEYQMVRKRALVIQQVNMKMLAQDAWEELRFGQGDLFPVTFHVQPELPACSVDIELMRIVWLKLLDNALKFSNPTNACIEVGSQTTGQNVTYYVRDNGSGFDMRYAKKIFNVFERLNRQEDFQGSGVGLAIALRIIQRHKGRIWAESAPGQGATFYFTLIRSCELNPRVEYDPAAPRAH